MKPVRRNPMLYFVLAIVFAAVGYRDLIKSPSLKDSSLLESIRGQEFAQKAKLLAECRLAALTNCDEKLSDGTLMTVESYSFGKQNGFSVSSVLTNEEECKKFLRNSIDIHIGVMLNQMVVKNIGSEMHYAVADNVCVDGSALFKASIRVVHT